MKVVQINSTCSNGSTGKICTAISKLLTAQNIENYILYAVGSSNYALGIKYMFPFEVKLSAFLSRVSGNYGFQARNATKRLIKQLESISPDIIHLHNLHSHNVHLGMLFAYLKRKKNIKVLWTFHDCWAFTAYCPYYTLTRCEKWKDGCDRCHQAGHYSWLFDRSAELYQMKKELFIGLDMTVVTPSQWLADQVKQSFLSEYNVKVLHNGIDLNIFRPIKSNFRQRYGIHKDAYVVLGVAFDWERRKGLDVFLQLAQWLDSSQYQIVLVGTNDVIDKQLPNNIYSIHRTQNQQELAQIYTAADVFVNPTREENYPTVNMEAIACGTPVLTFRTGGSPEIVDTTCGTVVDCDDVEAMYQQIVRICQTQPYTEKSCVYKARQFDKTKRYEGYLKLYMALYEQF